MLKFLLYVLFFTTLHLAYSQENRKYVSGKIVADSLSTEYIHVINKSTNIATITNEFGEFRIPVKANYTLLFSSILFVNKNLITATKHVKNLQAVLKSLLLKVKIFVLRLKSNFYIKIEQIY